MRRLAPLILGLVLWLPSLHATAQTSLAAQLTAEVNRFRVDNGKVGFGNQSQLMRAAQAHANWMASTGNYSHTGEGGSTIISRARAVGYNGYVYETIAWGSQNYVSVQWAVHWWSNSAVHREILLSDNTQIGAGVATNASDYVYVVMVGRPYSNSSSGPAEDAPGEDDTSPRDDPPIIQMVPIEVAAPREDGSVVHVVQEGQTAWAIASRYDVELDEMLAINHMDRSTLLFVGDEVIVKLGPNQTPPPEPTVPATYQVGEGQTIWEIAVTHGLTVDELLALNGLQRGDVINPGDVLQLREGEGVVVATPDATVDEAAPTATPLVLPTIAAVQATDIPTTLPLVTNTPTVVVPTETLTPTMIMASNTPPPVAAPAAVESGDEDGSSFSIILVVIGTIVVVGIALVGTGTMILARRE